MGASSVLRPQWELHGTWYVFIMSAWSLIVRGLKYNID